jgi:3-oxoacyl-[acyl-carrier-protein] synthase-3
MTYARIVSTGMSLPEKVMTNDDISKIVDTSDEWIQSRTGIRERRVAAEHEATSTFATAAAQQALDNAGEDAKNLDAIIVATITPDCPFPASACLVQKNLGATRACAYDLSAACSGYLYALATADAYIRSGLYKNIMVIGAETLTKCVDWQDRGSCILFGDGAGATLVRPSEEPGIRYSDLGCDGNHFELIYIPVGGTKTPLTEENIKERKHFAVVNGRDVYKLAVKQAEIVIRRALEENYLTVDDIKLLIPHQANQRITDAVQERLGFPKEKVASNIDIYGNTSAATVPICLHEAAENGTIQRGDKVLLVAFGAGFTWGTVLLDW